MPREADYLQGDDRAGLPHPQAACRVPSASWLGAEEAPPLRPAGETRCWAQRVPRCGSAGLTRFGQVHLPIKQEGTGSQLALTSIQVQVLRGRS